MELQIQYTRPLCSSYASLVNEHGYVTHSLIHQKTDSDIHPNLYQILDVQQFFDQVTTDVINSQRSLLVVEPPWGKSIP